MDSNVVTLIVALAAIAATSFGHYLTVRARSAPLREILYSRQIELISQIIYKQGRFRVYATILIDEDSPFKERARHDIGNCMKNYSELTERAAAILPTDLWVEIKRLSNSMSEFLVNYDEKEKLDEKHLIELSAMDAKVALVSRVVLGIDELTEESLKLFSNVKDFEKLAKIESEEFKVFAKRNNG